MRPRIGALPLALAALLTQAPASFAQEAAAYAGAICIGPVNITESFQFTLPTDNGGAYKFSSTGTPRSLPFTVAISGRSVDDIQPLESQRDCHWRSRLQAGRDRKSTRLNSSHAK